MLRYTESVTRVAALHETRAKLAEARAKLRSQQDDFAYVKAQAEMQVVHSVGGTEKALGENAEARARALIVLLEGDPTYLGSRALLRAAQARMEELDAMLTCLIDERQAIDLELREMIVSKWVMTGTPPPSVTILNPMDPSMDSVDGR